MRAAIGVGFSSTASAVRPLGFSLSVRGTAVLELGLPAVENNKLCTCKCSECELEAQSGGRDSKAAATLQRV